MNRYRCSSPVLWGVIVGCVVVMGPETESRAGSDAISKEAKETTVEATKKYTAQQKEAFQQKVQEELSAVQRQIAMLQGKARDVSAGVRADLQRSIDELEKQKEKAKEKLATLRDATDDRWSAMKSGVDATLNDMKQTYRKALAHLP